MVTVNKNNVFNSENITLKKNKVFKENLDGVFAELFSLVNMDDIENSDITKKNLLESSLKNKEFIEFGKNNFKKTFFKRHSLQSSCFKQVWRNPLNT